jgi:hypothetical protein
VKKYKPVMVAYISGLQRLGNGPCGMTIMGCTLCGRAVGNGMSNSILCEDCHGALTDPDSNMGRALREGYREALRKIVYNCPKCGGDGWLGALGTYTCDVCKGTGQV